jgi:hypothetical protein
MEALREPIRCENQERGGFVQPGARKLLHACLLASCQRFDPTMTDLQIPVNRLFEAFFSVRVSRR